MTKNYLSCVYIETKLTSQVNPLLTPFVHFVSLPQWSQNAFHEKFFWVLQKCSHCEILHLGGKPCNAFSLNLFWRMDCNISEWITIAARNYHISLIFDVVFCFTPVSPTAMLSCFIYFSRWRWLTSILSTTVGFF